MEWEKETELLKQNVEGKNLRRICLQVEDANKKIPKCSEKDLCFMIFCSYCAVAIFVYAQLFVHAQMWSLSFTELQVWRL